MLILGIGILAVLAVLLYASYTENKRSEKMSAEIAEIRIARTKDIRTVDSILDRVIASEQMIHSLRNRPDITTKIINDLEVLTVRQRSLEKKIIGAGRTVNLIFDRPIPMQIENIPHRKKPPVANGKGKKALIPDMGKLL